MANPQFEKDVAQQEIVDVYQQSLDSFNEFLKSDKNIIPPGTFDNYYFPFLYSVNKRVNTVQTAKQLSMKTVEFWKEMKKAGVTCGELTFSKSEAIGGSSVLLTTRVAYKNAEGELVKDVTQKHIYNLIPSMKAAKA